MFPVIYGHGRPKIRRVQIQERKHTVRHSDNDEKFASACWEFLAQNQDIHSISTQFKLSSSNHNVAFLVLWGLRSN
jgi:hypothetical protein